jgi:hypothetical protein
MNEEPNIPDPSTQVELNESLKLAIETNNTKIIKLFIESGGDPNTKQSNGNTLLLSNISTQDIDMITFLLEKGADPNMKSEKGISPIAFACLIKNVEILKLLLEKGADPNTMLNNKNSVLTSVIGIQHVEMVKVLLEHGADPNKKDDAGYVPLATAFKYQNKEIINMLVKAGAERNIDMFNKTKNTINALNFVEINYPITKTNYTKAINELKKDCPSKEFPTIPGGNCWIDSTMVGLTYAPDIGRTMRAALIGAIVQLEESNVSNVTELHTTIDSWNLKRAWKIYISRMLLFFLIGNKEDRQSSLTCPLLSTWIEEYRKYTLSSGRGNVTKAGGNVEYAIKGILNGLTLGEHIVYQESDRKTHKLDINETPVSKEELASYEPQLMYVIVKTVRNTSHVVVFFICSGQLYLYDNNHGLFPFEGMSEFPTNLTIQYTIATIDGIRKYVSVEYSIQTRSKSQTLLHPLIKPVKSMQAPTTDIWSFSSYSMIYSKQVYNVLRRGENIMNMASAPRYRRLSLPLTRVKTVKRSLGGSMKRRKTRKYRNA